MVIHAQLNYKTTICCFYFTENINNFRPTANFSQFVIIFKLAILIYPVPVQRIQLYCPHTITLVIKVEPH